MIRPHLETIAMSQVDIGFVAVVNAVASFGCLQVDISHTGIVANRLPEHFALIVAQVDAVYMGTRILTL